MTEHNVPNDVLERLIGKMPLNPTLNEGERQTFRMLSQPGEPLYRILQSVLDYTDERREAIARADLDTEEGLRLARKLQLQRDATLEFTAWFVGLYASPAQRVQKRNFSDG